LLEDIIEITPFSTELRLPQNTDMVKTILKKLWVLFNMRKLGFKRFHCVIINL